MLRIVHYTALSAIALLLLVLPAAASLTDIPAGGTVFVGEQGLNIAAAGVTAGSQVAFWGPGRNPQTDAPSDTQTVTDPSSFYVAPSTFATETGTWYTYPGRQVAFMVKDPSLAVRVINDRTGREVSSGFVSGDEIRFRIETNMYVMAQRSGVAGVPVTVKVKGPDGTEYTSLVNASGLSTSLVNIPVNSQLYETGPVWDTSSKLYRPGSYEVWAECNANGMKDNYDQPGKTTTRTAQPNPTVQVGGTTGPSITLVGSATPTATVTTTSTATTSATSTPIATTPAANVTTATIIPMTTTAPTTTVPATATPTPTRSPGFGLAEVGALGLVGLGLIVLRRY